jgi:cytochrome c oxidase subunit 2
MKFGPFLIWPQMAASEAGGVDFVTALVLGVCSFFALAVLFCLLFFLIVYRQGRAADRRQPPLTNHKLEMAWIVLPTLLSLGLFWVGAANIIAFISCLRALT